MPAWPQPWPVPKTLVDMQLQLAWMCRLKCPRPPCRFNEVLDFLFIQENFLQDFLGITCPLNIPTAYPRAAPTWESPRGRAAITSYSVSCPGESCHHSCSQPLMPPLSVFKGVITPLPVPVDGAAPQGAARLPVRAPYMAVKWRRSPGTVNRHVVYFSLISLLIPSSLTPSLSRTLSRVLAPSSGDTSKNKHQLFLLAPLRFSARGKKVSPSRRGLKRRKEHVFVF